MSLYSNIYKSGQLNENKLIRVSSEAHVEEILETIFMIISTILCHKKI